MLLDFNLHLRNVVGRNGPVSLKLNIVLCDIESRLRKKKSIFSVILSRRALEQIHYLTYIWNKKVLIHLFSCFLMLLLYLLKAKMALQTTKVYKMSVCCEVFILNQSHLKLCRNEHAHQLVTLSSVFGL